MKKLFLFCLCVMAVHLGFGQTIFTQNFEMGWTLPPTLTPAWSGTTTPADNVWHQSAFSSGWTSNYGAYVPLGANSTTASARFHSGDAVAGSSGDFITPTIDLSAYAAGTVKLDFYHLNTSGSDVLNIYVSNDNGTTWSAAIAPSPLGLSAAWILKSITLAGNSATTKIKFTGTSDWGNSDIGIDEVRVYFPVTANGAPTFFAASLVTQTGMTIGWTDNSTNETAFRVYRSTDNVVFTKVGADIVSTSTGTTGTLYSQVQTGLAGSTTYYYRITAVNDLESSYLTGSQATIASTLTGIKTIGGTSPDYLTIASAIADLNAQGVGIGGVTFNVAPGYTETFVTPTAGYITTMSSSAARPVVFQKSGAGVNPVVTAPAGTGTTDAIIAMAGCDYITFDGINLMENAANTTTVNQMEWGYAILKASATDGSQNITIKNCSITLVKTNTASVGIYANNVTVAAPATQLAVTSITGANSNLRIYSNTITNCYNGIMIYGFNDPVAPNFFYDQNNEIGKDGANFISNFGGSTVANNGIYTIYQNTQTIANNNITGPSAGSGACAGILLGASNNSNVDLYANTVSIIYSGTGTFYGIYDNRGNTYSGATKMNNYNNTVTGCTYTTAVSGTCYYIYFNGGAATCNAYGNVVTGNTYGSATTTSTGTIYGIYFNGCQNTTGIVSFYNNQVTNNARVQSVLGAGTNYYLYLNGGGTQSNFYNNTVDNNTAASTGTCAAMYALNNPSGNKNIYGNTLTNILNSYGTVYGIYTGNSGGTSIYRNKIQNLNAMGAANVIYGIYLSSLTSGNMYCYNNMISDLRTPASSSTSAIIGIYVLGTGVSNMGIYNNTVYLNASSTGANFGTAGLYLSSSPQNIESMNNIVVNTSVASGTGYTTALRLGSTSLLNYASTSNNNDFYAGTPGPVNFIYYDGTNADPLLSSFKARVFPRESQSMTENPPFLSTATPMNLHINPATPTQVESAGLVVALPGISTDYDNNPRYPNSGYPVNALYPPIAPDLGADEFGGIPLDLTPPVITYAPLLNTSSLTARTLVATITDMRGVPTSGNGLPRVAWKKFYNGTWAYVTGISLGGTQYSFNFGGGVATNDSIYYYVLAQDSWTNPNVGTFPIVGAGGFSASPPAATSHPANPYKYKIIQGICGTFNVGAGQVYTTLTTAIADLSGKDLTCPVTLLLTDNDYPLEAYPIIIPQIAGASAVNTLTIKPAPGKTPAFITSYLGVTPNYWSQITLNGAQYVIIDGSNSGGTDRSLTFQNTAGSGFAAAIGLYNNGTIGASNIVIKNCMLQAHKEAVFNAQGIVLYSITGNAGYRNVVINNNAVNSAKFGIAVAGIPTNKASNIQVTNNTIGSTLDANSIMLQGITMSSADSVLIEGNEIIGPVNGNAVGPQAVFGMFIGSGSTNFKVRKNNIHDWNCTANGAIGIYYNAEASSVNEISNNVIHTIKSVGFDVAGIYIVTGGNLQLYHNSINLSGNFLSPTTAATTSCITIGNNITQINMRDNILKNSLQPSSGTPASKSYAVNAGTNPTGLTFNYNDYFVDGIGPNIGYFGGASQATLVNWQTATGQDANSLSVDPAFTSATNLLPTTTGMPHAGVFITTVPTDIAGVNRTNPPDVGAFEFTVNPIITTLAASAVSYATATLNGNANAAGNTFNLNFDWGLTSAYGSSAAASPALATGNTLINMSMGLTGLTGNTTYHYRARGITSGGLIVYGNDMTFTSAPDPPAVITTAATSITSLGATVNGTVNANSASTIVTFEYGLTTAYGNTISATPNTVTGTIVTSVSASITGLQPNTTYHFRARGVNVSGTTNGNDMTFTTIAIPAAVVTNFANPVATTTATLNGTITANNAATTVTFQWGLTIAYGNTVSGTPSSVNGITPTSALANLTGLAINTTYHFRCVGVNVAGTTNGLDQTFTTNCVAPAIAITGPATACTQSVGNVYNTQAGNTNYQWSISAGGVITAGTGTNTITVTWNTAGAQSVAVNYQNSFGCSAAIPLSYPVAVNAVPSPTIAGPASVCEASTGNVYSTQSGLTNYLWVVSAGGTITAGSGTNAITVTWTTAGTKTISVNYTNASGCAAPSPTVLNITVNALSVPTISGQNSVCANSGYIQYTTEAAMTGYIWTVSSGGTISAGQGTNAIQVTWTSTGSQTVGVNYANASGCFAAAPASYSVAVNGTPGAAGVITGTSVICGGAQGVAYSCAPITGAGYYVWILPAGGTIASGGGTASIMVNYATNASSGNITVYGNNLCGNGSTSPNFPVTVTALPASAGAITGASAVCQGSSGVIYTVTAIANATGYTWTLPAGATVTSGQNTNAITVSFGASAVSGNITVFGTNSCGNGTVSPSYAIIVNPVPSAPVVTVNGIILSSNVATGNQWYFSATQGGTGNIIPGANSQTCTATQTGWYWTVINVGGCSSDPSIRVYILMVGQQILQTGNFNVYPVPSDGRFTVSLVSLSQESFTISVFNNLGVKIYEEKEIQVNGSFNQVIDLRPAASGIYTIVVSDNTSRIAKKIIVRN